MLACHGNIHFIDVKVGLNTIVNSRDVAQFLDAKTGFLEVYKSCSVSEGLFSGSLKTRSRPSSWTVVMLKNEDRAL